MLRALCVLALSTVACSTNKTEGASATATTTAAPASTTATTPQSGDIAVKADETGFVPASVSVAKGKPATLVFTRTSDATCATEVVFPDLKIEKKLPKGEAVRVELPTGEARTYAFQCGMAMYKSKVVVQ